LVCVSFGEPPSHQSGPPTRAGETLVTASVSAFQKTSKAWADAQSEYEKLKDSFLNDGFIDYGGKRLGATDGRVFLNLAFLHTSLFRLQEEIAEIEKRLSGPFARTWMKAAEEQRLAAKRAAVEELEKLLSLVQRTGIPLAEDLIHLKELLAISQRTARPNALGNKGSAASDLAKATGFIQALVTELQQNPMVGLDQIPAVEKLLAELPAWEELAEKNTGLVQTREFLEAKALLMALARQHPREAAFSQLLDKERVAAPERNVAANKFLKEVSAHSDAVKKQSVDLSDKFHSPLSQGKLFSCVAHALASDMGTHVAEAPSANYGYALLSWGQMLLDEELGAENLDSGKISPAQAKKAAEAIAGPENFPDNLKQLWAEIGTAQGQNGAPAEQVANRGISFDLAEAIFKKQGLPSEKNHPSVSDNFIPQSLNQVGDRKYVLKQVKRLGDSPTVEEVRKMLDHGQPFQMVIASDARYIQEDWVRIDPYHGSIPHVFNVVGYDEGIDPLDNKRKPFLWIRDSFTPGKFHYKASVESILPYAMELLRVTEVGELKKPVTYEKFK
jgi:hypothetical protein